MCGIVGAIGYRGDPEKLERAGRCAINAIKHRGPDRCDRLQQGSFFVWQARLSIRGQNAHLPMTRGKGILAYNGEIYNTESLKKALESEVGPIDWQTAGDSEVVLQALDHWGIAAFSRFEGMFAIAYWDGESLLLARDRFGIKPLFYYDPRFFDLMSHVDGCAIAEKAMINDQQGGMTAKPFPLYFASEIKALLEMPGVQRQVNPTALFDFFSHNYVPGPLTAFKGIVHVPAGMCLQITQAGRMRRHPIAVPPDQDPDMRLDSEGAILDALVTAVERRLVSDAPLGLMLSGGMDSSSLAACMRILGRNTGLQCYGLSFSESSFDEFADAERVAQFLGCRLQRVDVTPGNVMQAFDQVVACMDEPFGDGSSIPTWLLAQRAAKDVKVLLSGEGGDELFVGYDTYAAWNWCQVYRHVPPFLRRALITPLTRCLPLSRRKLSFEFKAKRFVHGAELPPVEAHFFWRHVLCDHEKRQMLREVPEGLVGSRHFHHCAQLHNGSEIEKLLAIDRHYHLGYDVLIKTDRCTMAHSIETRVPFLDRDLVARVDRLPMNKKMRLGQNKPLLRRIMAEHLPRQAIKKPKLGLEMPYSQWMRGPWKSWCSDFFDAKRLERCELFDVDQVRHYWHAHTQGQADHGRFLWGLMQVVRWHEIFIQS